MATATFLSGATCNITPTGGAAVDVSDQLSKCEVMVGFELLESTSLADTGRQAVKGLQSVAVNLDLYLSFLRHNRDRNTFERNRLCWRMHNCCVPIRHHRVCEQSRVYDYLGNT
jgi:hypothetical protein